VDPRIFKLFLDWLYFRFIPGHRPTAICGDVYENWDEEDQHFDEYEPARTLAYSFVNTPKLDNEYLEETINNRPHYDYVYGFADRIDVPGL